MRSKLQNLKTMLNNSIYKYGLSDPKTLLISKRVDEEVNIVQREMVK